MTSVQDALRTFMEKLQILSEHLDDSKLMQGESLLIGFPPSSSKDIVKELEVSSEA